MAGTRHKPECGTPEGFRWHGFLKQEPCERCVFAMEQHERKIARMRSGSRAAAQSYQARIASVRAAQCVDLPQVPQIPSPVGPKPAKPSRPAKKKAVRRKRPPVLESSRSSVRLRRDVYDALIRIAHQLQRGEADVARAGAETVLLLINQKGTSESPE